MGIKTYKERVMTLLKDYDNARTVFELETKVIEDEYRTKCINSFIIGAVISGLVVSVTFMILHNDRPQILEAIKERMK